MKMDVLTFETCRALNNEIIKQATSSWSIVIQLLCGKLVIYKDNTRMHGQQNIKLRLLLTPLRPCHMLSQPSDSRYYNSDTIAGDINNGVTFYVGPTPNVTHLLNLLRCKHFPD